MKLRRSLPNIGIASLLGALLLAGPVSAQARGALFGVVLDDRSDTPLSGARVVVVGSATKTEVGSDGLFLLPDLPIGPVQLRFEQAGYSSSVEQIDIASDSLTALEVRMVPIALLLEDLVVTAHKQAAESGSAVAEVRPEGNSRTSLTAADLIANIPNLRVQPDGRAGVSIRGVSSITQSDAPAIYLDGIRVMEVITSGSTEGPRASGILSRIPARDVLRIRVLKGPSAPAQYGDAANGVILIETNREGASR
jgi:iron complex outermembrane receptor protein